MNRFRRLLLPSLVLALASVSFAQWGRRHRGPSSLEEYRNYSNFPEWSVAEGFRHETFTFARVRYSSGWYGRGGGWRVDWPDSDLNFSLRLQQLTSMKVNPDPVIVSLDDEQISDYPFLYMIEPGSIELTQPEIEGLRRYCDNGGFVMVDDFWGAEEYFVFSQAMRQVFPNREAEELDISHEIFHNVYDIKEKPQIPSMRWIYDRSYTWERDKGPSAREVHFRAIKDDDERIMVLICHNTDLGDGWEREGVDRDYFETYSVKKAYPMGINIVTYAMTH